MTHHMEYSELVAFAVEKSSPAQLEKLNAMIKIGWKVTKVSFDASKASIALVMKGTAAWLLVDGKIERAAVGQKSVRINFQTQKRA